MVEVLKVSSHSNPNAVAGALAGVVRSAGAVEIQVVGAGALNQAVKAVAIARGYLTPSGVDLVCIPTFADIQIDGERRTAIRLLCENRAVAAPTVDLRTHEVSRAQRRANDADAAEPTRSARPTTEPSPPALSESRAAPSEPFVPSADPVVAPPESLVRPAADVPAPSGERLVLPAERPITRF
jgi:stage V sporulation protein S